MYVILLVVLVLSYGCRSCDVTGHPEDTVGEVGENATLRCSTDFTDCRFNRCAVHWERETNNIYDMLSICTSVYPRYPDSYSVSFGPDWSLTITGVQRNDAGRYRCITYAYRTHIWSHSSPATLIIPSLIDINVQPPRHPITTGDNATFHCNVQSQNETLPTFNVKWFVNGTNVSRFQDQSFYHLDNDGYTLTFLKISVNTNVSCKAFSGTKYVKRSDEYLIFIHPQKKPITSATQVPETEESLTVNSAKFPHDTDEPSATQVPETKESQPNPGSTNFPNTAFPNNSTTLTEKNIPSVTVEGVHQSSSIQHSLKNPDLQTFILVGGVFTAVFLMLVISFLIYCLVFKRQSKATRNTRSASTPQDDGGESDADGISDTQLHGVTSRCDQENDHASSEQNHPESMYAVVDKSRSKSKKLGAISTEEAPWEVFGGRKGGSKLNRGTDTAQTLSSYSKHEIPSEHQKSTVAVKDLPVPVLVVDCQPSGQKPFSRHSVPSLQMPSEHHDPSQAALEQTADRGEDGIVKDDPRKRNVEGLIYADMDLSRGSARIINTEEETVYADIGNKKTLG